MQTFQYTLNSHSLSLSQYDTREYSNNSFILKDKKQLTWPILNAVAYEIWPICIRKTNKLKIIYGTKFIPCMCKYVWSLIDVTKCFSAGSFVEVFIDIITRFGPHA